MDDYDIIIRIGASGLNEDEVLDQYSHILFFIQDSLPMDNYNINVVKRGEWVE